MLPLWLQDSAQTRAFAPGRQRTRYVVMRRQDVWFIHYSGDNYGPYISQREAMLFAVDAAQKLGALGEDTEVLRVDEHGEPQPAWSYGLDPYPPRL